MKKLSNLFIIALLLLTTTIAFASNEQNLQLFSLKTSDSGINAKSVEKAFNASGLVVDVNNDMNSIFEKRYKHVHHQKYNLAIFHSDEMIKKLIKKYPSIGLITPLSMSIYFDGKSKSLNISTLSLAGMARITKIPVTNPDLIAYAKLVDAALHKALPGGKYLTLNHPTKALDKPLVTAFSMEISLEEGETIMDIKDAFEEEFEGELGPVGFLVPKSYNLGEGILKDHDVYDFFDTYSIIRFNAIYPVSKNHPDAGAYAPFSLSIYKKKGEDKLYISYPSIDNWIVDLDIKEKETIKEVENTQEMIKGILEELTE